MMPPTRAMASDTKMPAAWKLPCMLEDQLILCCSKSKAWASLGWRQGASNYLLPAPPPPKGEQAPRLNKTWASAFPSAKQGHRTDWMVSDSCGRMEAVGRGP